MKKENFRFYWEKPVIREEEIREKEVVPLIKFDIPGFQKGEIKVHLENNMITVSAQKKNINEKKGKNFYSYSTSSSAFSRSMSLPYGIDPKEFEISIADGAVTLKKKKKVKEKN